MIRGEWKPGGLGKHLWSCTGTEWQGGVTWMAWWNCPQKTGMPPKTLPEQPAHLTDVEIEAESTKQT